MGASNEWLVFTADEIADGIKKAKTRRAENIRKQRQTSTQERLAKDRPTDPALVVVAEADSPETDAWQDINSGEITLRLFDVRVFLVTASLADREVHLEVIRLLLDYAQNHQINSWPQISLERMYPLIESFPVLRAVVDSVCTVCQDSPRFTTKVLFELQAIVDDLSATMPKQLAEMWSNQSGVE